MKIGILTLPLGENVGGTLQAYALNRVLNDMGYEAETICNYISRASMRPLIRLYMHFTEYFQRNFARRKIRHSRFVLRNRKDLDGLAEKYDAIIVGSDQVWRLGCTNDNFNYMLGYAHGSRRQTKIAYSCSFGVSPEEIRKEWNVDNFSVFSNALNNFDYISVREKSAVDFCRRYTDKPILHLLDPTMLLSADDYLKLIGNYSCVYGGGKKLFYYVLDNSTMKECIKSVVVEKLGFDVVKITTRKRIKDLPSHKSLDPTDYMFPSVEKWLGSISKADFVVTDSFHGMVFSVIFNKNFIVIDNAERGSERFTSFLQMFGLEDRLVRSLEDYESKCLAPIDYNRVNYILQKRREESLGFLKHALSL